MFLWYTQFYISPLRLETVYFAYWWMETLVLLSWSFDHNASLQTVNARQVVRVTHSGPTDFSGPRLHIGVSHRHMGKMLP